MKENVVLTVIAVLVFVFTVEVVAQAAERKVRLKVPEMVCASRGAAAVAAATSVGGVSSADDDLDNTILTVVYDDGKTTVEAISKALAKEKFPVDGEPVFVK